MHLSKPSHSFRLHLTVFIFGFTAILGELITLEAIPLVFHRMWLAALFVFLYLAATKRTDFKLNKDAAKILLAGAVIAAHWIAFFHSIKISNVSVTLACVSTGALFGSLLEPLFYRRKIDPRELVLGLFVIAGLYLIFRFEGDYTAGIIMGLIAAFLAALFQVINGKLVKNRTPYRITFLEMLGGFLAIGIYLLFQGKLNAELFSISGMDWLWLLLLGSLCTAFAFIESVAVMRSLSPFTVLLSINLEPVYGIILALLIFGDSERMDPLFYLGTSIILLSVVADSLLKTIRKRRLSKIVQGGRASLAQKDHAPK